MFHPAEFVHYNFQKVKDWNKVLVPPYDVLSSDEEKRCKALSPFNFTHLDKPEPTAKGYKQSHETFEEWLKSGVLVEASAPHLLFYEMTFKWGDSHRTRFGVIGVMDLFPYSERRVLPHERTLRPHVEDRLALMRATRSQLSPIFVMAHDPRRNLINSWTRFTESGSLLCDLTDSAGSRHRVTRVFDSAAFTLMEQVCRDSQNKVMIVDGHHRYETALQFSEEMKNSGAGAGNWNRIMTYLTTVEDEGLMILTTHRMMHSYPQFEERRPKIESVMKERGWAIQKMPHLAALEAEMIRTTPTDNALTMVIRDGTFILWRRARAGESDFDLLQTDLLSAGFGMTQHQIDQATYLRYVRGADSHLIQGSLEEKSCQAMFLLNPVSKKEVFDRAATGRVFPQKTTYFYPKILSGVGVYRF